MKTVVAILNWNGRNFLEKFLPSVTKFSNQPDVSVFVIDNASSDDSLDFLKQNYPQIELVILDKNYGYAGGYNKGLEQIDAKYFVLLNSDIEVTENWINPIIELMESDDKIVACQPKILAYNNKEFFEYAGASGGFIDKYGYPFCRGRIFDTIEKDNHQYDD
ncbi:MAG: glycosyltransferase family 2 protein, partial [Bacteroidetes bacterium]